MNGDVYMSDVSAPNTPGPTRMSTRPRLPSFAGREPQTLAEAAAMRATPQGADFERTTRSKVAKPKVATAKVKLKLGDKATQGIGTSFLGPYDRELDTEDEEDQDLVFEEQFILKMPEGEDCEKLRAMVQARAVTPDVWFKFKGGSIVPAASAGFLTSSTLTQTQEEAYSTSALTNMPQS